MFFSDFGGGGVGAFFEIVDQGLQTNLKMCLN
jgi:hypothetical protein